MKLEQGLYEAQPWMDAVDWLPKRVVSDQWYDDPRAPFHARFYRNGDRFYCGFEYVITPKRMRDFKVLMDELSHCIFCDQLFLPLGVRYIFTLDGQRISRTEEMQENGQYVCSSTVFFQALDYANIQQNPKWKFNARNGHLPDIGAMGAPHPQARRARSSIGHPTRNPSSHADPADMGSRIIHVVAHGAGRPRRIEQFLLNWKTAPFFEKLMGNISAKLALNSGFVKKMYNLMGEEVKTLGQFFDETGVFFAIGKEQPQITRNDLKLTVQEMKKIDENKRNKIKKPRNTISKISEPIRNSKVKFRRRVSNYMLPTYNTDSYDEKPISQLKNKYEVGAVIAAENCTTIRECWYRNTKLALALKEVDVEKCVDYDAIEREISILLEMKHHNLQATLDVFRSKEKIYLVTELYQNGNILYQILESDVYSELDVSGIIFHLASALAYLHAKRIVHRDVRLENLLVQCDEKGTKTLKLCDFGVASYVTNGPLAQVCGTPCYMAPEILQETGYSMKVDVWSAGVVAAVLLTGQFPYGCPQKDHNVIFNRLMMLQHVDTSTEQWSHVSSIAKDFVLRCLSVIPSQRISSHEMLLFPWIKNDSLPSKENIFPIVGSSLSRLIQDQNSTPLQQGLAVITATAADKGQNYFLTQD